MAAMRKKFVAAGALIFAALVCLLVARSLSADVPTNSPTTHIAKWPRVPLGSSPVTSASFPPPTIYVSTAFLQVTSTPTALSPIIRTTDFQSVNRFPKDGLIRPHPRIFCCDLILGIPLETICPSNVSKTTSVPVARNNSTKCTCEDFLYCRLVVMTAISSNHFREAQDMIAGVQANLPYTHLIVYDLGLSIGEKIQLSKYCNVEVRPLDFSKYPLHVEKLETFAWKPIITSEITREYEIVMYGDASLRIFQPAMEKLLPFLLEFPFVSGPTGEQPITALTHDSTLNYLGLNMPRAMAAREIHQTLQTIYCVWFTAVIREKWLKRWLDCALHEECIAPPGTSQYGCNFDLLRKGDGAYIGCHRFDQSALNIILYQEFGRERWEGLAHAELNDGPRHYWDVQRAVTHFYKVKTSNCQ